MLPLEDSGNQNLASKIACILARDGNTSHTVVAKANVKGFDKPGLFFSTRGSNNYVRRCFLEKNMQYAEVIQTQKGNTISVCLATGTLVAVPNVSEN